MLKYLRIYEKYLQLEMLMKAGLSQYFDSVTILKRIGKDKSFGKWLIRNRKELTSKWRGYYVDVIMQAYKTGYPLEELQKIVSLKKSLIKDSDYKPLIAQFTGKDLGAFCKYLEEQKIMLRQYLDYFKACVYLHLDMTQAKNNFPHDFRKWHDIRIDQYATARPEADKQRKQALYEKFADIAEKYVSLQHAKKSAFICVVARSPADLVHEGEALYHCAGRMNYDHRFVREESLIFFIRAEENPDVPFVTLEYSLQTHKVLQCYATYDHRPNDDVLHYVNKVWLPYANKQIKLIAA